MTDYTAYLKSYVPDERLSRAPKGLIVRSGLYWTSPTPNPPPGKASHEMMGHPRLDLEAAE